MAPLSATQARRLGPVLIISLLLSLPATVQLRPQGLQNTLEYVKGAVDPDRDLSATVTPEGYICSILNKECYCKGQLCTLIADVVLQINATVMTLMQTVVQRIPSHAYVSTPQLEVLEIIQGSLKTVDAYAFYGLKRLRVLNLCYNNITRLGSKSLIGLDSLEELVLMKNGIQTLDAIMPAIVPRILPSLTLLHVSGNTLKTIGENTFEPMQGSKLDYIHVVLCGLIYIHPKGFEPLTKLKSLIIKNNNQLSEDILLSVFENPRVPKITTLDIGVKGYSQFPTRLLSALARTKLKLFSMHDLQQVDLSNNSFPTMPNLQELQLNGNMLQNIKTGAFDGLVNLRTLVIQRNQLTFFPEALKLHHLESLDLSGIRKQLLRFDLPDLTFSAMAHLQSLDLSYKSLLTLSKNTFYGLSNLTLLNVRKCGINSVKDDAFMHLTSLRSLDISENPLFELGVVSEKLFYGLGRTLDWLILQDVGYQGEDDRFWSNLEQLQMLDISNNSLSKIDDLVPRLKNLKWLYASSNQIQAWTKPILDNTNTSLETLDLSHNFVRTVSSAMVADFARVGHLNISQNPFKCDCDFKDFLVWYNTTPSEVSLFKRSRPSKNLKSICSEPKQYAQMSVATLGATLVWRCNMESLSRVRIMLACLAVLLIIMFTLTIFIYIFRRKIRQAIWNEHELISGNFIYDAFVSYSANDSDWVFNYLLPHIETNTSNLRLCVYDRDFLAGEAITDCILESIKNSRRVLLVVSNHFVKSPWCRLETELARHVLLDDNREGLLLIQLEKLDLSKVHAHLRFLLSTRLYLSWTAKPNEQDDFWRKLQRALGNNPKYPKGKQNERSSSI